MGEKGVTEEMQNFINGVFIFAASMVILITAVFALCSLSMTDDRGYGIGWLWGVVACLCAVAIYYCSVVGIIPLR